MSSGVEFLIKTEDQLEGRAWHHMSTSCSPIYWIKQTETNVQRS